MKLIISLMSLSLYCAPVLIKYDNFKNAMEVKKILKIHFNFPESFIQFKKEKCSKELGQNRILEICIKKEIEILANRKMLNENYKIFRELK